MKKILFLLILSACLTGCSYRGERLDAGDIRNVPVVREFDYHGHHYIEFGHITKSHAIRTYMYDGGVVHDPDCPCHNKVSNVMRYGE